MWLNVSAILYNNELRKITEREGLLEGQDPIHFNEFEEIEESDIRSANRNNMYSLLLPE